MKNEVKHVIVTGGAGFIGSHLCEALLKRGCAVTVIDNLVTGSMKNIEALTPNRGFHFLDWDVSEPIPIGRVAALNDLGLAGLFH